MDRIATPGNQDRIDQNPIRIVTSARLSGEPTKLSSSLRRSLVKPLGTIVWPLLTTATTFLGLSPMILETSLQAQFLVPMAVSLGFGIVFATAITLILIPTQYRILEDLRSLVGIDTEEMRVSRQVPELEEV